MALAMVAEYRCFRILGSFHLTVHPPHDSMWSYHRLHPTSNFRLHHPLILMIPTVRSP